MSKTTITKNERLQLIGLVTIGRQHTAKAEEARRAAHELLGFNPDEYEGESGYLDDAVFDGNNRSIDTVLRNMKIEVK